MNFSLQFNNVKTLALGGPKGNAIVVGTADSFEKSCISLKKTVSRSEVSKTVGVVGSQNDWHLPSLLSHRSLSDLPTV